MKARISHLRKVGRAQKDMETTSLSQCQAMEDVSMVAQIEGFKHEQLLFVDEVLKQLGGYTSTSEKALHV